MDPNETLVLMIEAAMEGDTKVMMHSAVDLASWLNSGGFRPGPKAAYNAAIRAGFNPLDNGKEEE